MPSEGGDKSNNHMSLNSRGIKTSDSIYSREGSIFREAEYSMKRSIEDREKLKEDAF